MVQERIRGASAAGDQKDEAGGRHQGESAVTRRLGGRAGHDREESGSREQNQDWAFGFLKGLSPRPTLMLRHLGSGAGGGGVGGSLEGWEVDVTRGGRTPSDAGKNEGGGVGALAFREPRRPSYRN